MKTIIAELASGLALDIYNHQPVVAGFRSPDLAGAAIELAHARASVVAGETRELLGLRIEPHDRVCPEIRKPDIIVLVHIHGVGPGRAAGKLPAFPRPAFRIVHAYLPRIPLADPNPSLRVRPHAAAALITRRRLDHRCRASFRIDPRDMASCKGRVIDFASGRCRYAVGTPAFLSIGDFDLAGFRIKTAVDAGLAREPEHAFPVKGRGVEVRITALLRKRKYLDLLRPGVHADDCIEAAVRYPGRVI